MFSISEVADITNYCWLNTNIHTFSRERCSPATGASAFSTAQRSKSGITCRPVASSVGEVTTDTGDYSLIPRLDGSRLADLVHGNAVNACLLNAGDAEHHKF